MEQKTGMSAAEVNQKLVDDYTDLARLAGGLAHEIKNPLSTIRLNMELLMEDMAADESPRGRRAAQKVGVVQRECQRLQELLDDFLNFAKVRQPRLEPTDLNKELAELLDFYAPKFAESGVEVMRYFDPDLPRALLDAETFRGAASNLLINAQQAMPDGGQLVVRTRSMAPAVAVDLIDTGVGMSKRTLERIFDAFYSTKPGGSGLGLPTARKIVEAHGGRILVQSEEGQGTQFTILLPALRRLATEPDVEVLDGDAVDADSPAATAAKSVGSQSADGQSNDRQSQ